MSDSFYETNPTETQVASKSVSHAINPVLGGPGPDAFDPLLSLPVMDGVHVTPNGPLDVPNNSADNRRLIVAGHLEEPFRKNLPLHRTPFLENENPFGRQAMPFAISKALVLPSSPFPRIEGVLHYVPSEFSYLRPIIFPPHILIPRITAMQPRSLPQYFPAEHQVGLASGMVFPLVPKLLSKDLPHFVPGAPHEVVEFKHVPVSVHDDRTAEQFIARLIPFDIQRQCRKLPR
jgi:hypothetical protein